MGEWRPGRGYAVVWHTRSFSYSFAVGPPGGRGAGIAACAERGRTDGRAEAELWEELTLILVVFL